MPKSKNKVLRSDVGIISDSMVRGTSEELDSIIIGLNKLAYEEDTRGLRIGDSENLGGKKVIGTTYTKNETGSYRVLMKNDDNSMIRFETIEDFSIVVPEDDIGGFHASEEIALRNISGFNGTILPSGVVQVHGTDLLLNNQYQTSALKRVGPNEWDRIG